MPMLHHQSSSGSIGSQQLYGPGAGLQAMNAAGYGGMGVGQRQMYGIPGQNQFMQPHPQQGQGWPGPQNQGQGSGPWSQGFQ